VIESLILWQVVGARADERRMRGTNPTGQGSFELLILVAFLLTIFIWPVTAVYRTGLMKTSRPAAITVATLITVILFLGAAPTYVLIGFFWACFELALWINRNEGK
jgi:hypothetical protein